MEANEKKEKLTEIKKALEEKGLKTGFFYAKGGPSGLKMNLDSLEKLVEALENR